MSYRYLQDIYASTSLYGYLDKLHINIIKMWFTYTQILYQENWNNHSCLPQYV